MSVHKTPEQIRHTVVAAVQHAFSAACTIDAFRHEHDPARVEVVLGFDKARFDEALAARLRKKLQLPEGARAIVAGEEYFGKEEQGA